MTNVYLQRSTEIYLQKKKKHLEILKSLQLLRGLEEFHCFKILKILHIFPTHCNLNHRIIEWLVLEGTIQII